MNTLYYSLILSHLQYCTLLWANTYSICLNKLRILQKKAMRIITQSHYLAHTDPLFSKLKLLKLDDLYKHQLGIYMYKSTKGLLPDSMSSMVIPIHNVHDHHLRNQNGCYIQHVRTNCRKFTIHYTGPVFWNTLPEQLRQAVSENQFKRKLKIFYSRDINSTICILKCLNLPYIIKMYYVRNRFSNSYNSSGIIQLC